MCASGVAALEAAAAGREVKQAHEAAHGEAYDPEFTEGRGLRTCWESVRRACVTVGTDVTSVGTWRLLPQTATPPT